MCAASGEAITAGRALVLYKAQSEGDPAFQTLPLFLSFISIFFTSPSVFADRATALTQRRVPPGRGGPAPPGRAGRLAPRRRIKSEWGFWRQAEAPPCSMEIRGWGYAALPPPLFFFFLMLPGCVSYLYFFIFFFLPSLPPTPPLLPLATPTAGSGEVRGGGSGRVWAASSGRTKPP